MKTNALLIVILAAATTLITGCQTTPGGREKLSSWQSKISGEYKGSIFSGGEEYPATTAFKADGDKVSGTYSLDVYGTEYSGVLSEFSITSDRQLKCRWRDNENRTGNLSTIFSPDLSDFEGKWDADDGNGDGQWNGKK